MKEITINNVKYDILENVNDAIDKDVLSEGFYDSNNKKCKKINDIANLKRYIEVNCAYGCRWFELKRKNN